MNSEELVKSFFLTQHTISKVALKAEKELENYRESLIEDTVSYPTCDWCGEAITEDWYEIETDIVCPDCIEKCRKERT